MNLGVTSEGKTDERHVALTHAGVRTLPPIVNEEDVASIKPGVIDIDIGHGGFFDRIRETTHPDSVLVDSDVPHYTVATVAGAVPRTPNYAAEPVTLRCIRLLVAIRADRAGETAPEAFGAISAREGRAATPPGRSTRH